MLNNLVLGSVTKSAQILSSESGLTLIHKHQQKCAIYRTTDISPGATFSFLCLNINELILSIIVPAKMRYFISKKAYLVSVHGFLSSPVKKCVVPPPNTCRYLT